jgi:hypothetical protein
MAGSLQCEQFAVHRLRELDEHKLAVVKEVVPAALVDDTHKCVFLRAGVGDHGVDLADDERGLVPAILVAQRKLLRGSLHGRSR